jgi:hypothetical protein
MRGPGIFYFAHPVTLNGTRTRADVTKLAIELQRVGTYNWRQESKNSTAYSKGRGL